MAKKSITEVKQELVETVEKDVKKIEKIAKTEARQGMEKVSAQTSQFVDFIRERGVIGLAIGIIIGTAVSALVESVVGDIINPLIGLVLPSAERLTDSAFHIGSAEIRWGSFAVALLNFVVIALVIFFSFKLLKLDKLDKPKAKK